MTQPTSRGQLYDQAIRDIIAADNPNVEDIVRITCSLGAIAKLLLAGDKHYWMEQAPPLMGRHPAEGGATSINVGGGP